VGEGAAQLACAEDRARASLHAAAPRAKWLESSCLIAWVCTASFSIWPYMVVLTYLIARRLRAFFGGSDTIIAMSIGPSAIIDTKTTALGPASVTGPIRNCVATTSAPLAAARRGRTTFPYHTLPRIMLSDTTWVRLHHPFFVILKANRSVRARQAEDVNLHHLERDKGRRRNFFFEEDAYIGCCI
jgi:hypothetical protein